MTIPDNKKVFPRSNDSATVYLKKCNYESQYHNWGLYDESRLCIGPDTV